MTELLNKKILEHISLFETIHKSEALKSEVQKVAKQCVDAIKAGKKIMFCGNGGSMTDALHAAAELSGRYLKNRRPLPAIALGSNPSSVTAIANDFGYEEVFEREVRAVGQKGDVLIGISTSGRSKNVLKALESAKTLGITTVGLVGHDRKSPIANASQLAICIPSEATPRIQECHIFLLHFICEEIENAID